MLGRDEKCVKVVGEKLKVARGARNAERIPNEPEKSRDAPHTIISRAK